MPAQEALDTILNCVGQGQGIAILTGDPGAGKTALCRQLETALGPQFRPVYLGTSAFHTRRALLQAVLCELGSDYIGLTEQEARLRLMEAARDCAAQKQPVVLILDEAHLLSSRLLEELRTVSDRSADGAPLMRLVLAGQFPLEEKLTEPELSAFNQRIGVQTYLGPLSLQQSGDYIAARLSWAGSKEPESIYSDEALLAICRASDGNPRCLNQLADHALLLGFAAGSRPIPVEAVRTALKDLKELPLQWNNLTDDALSLVGSAGDEEANEHFSIFEPSGAELQRTSQTCELQDPHLLDTDEFEISEFLESLAGTENGDRSAEPIDGPLPQLTVIAASETADDGSPLSSEAFETDEGRDRSRDAGRVAVIEVGAGSDVAAISEGNPGTAEPQEGAAQQALLNEFGVHSECLEDEPTVQAGNAGGEDCVELEVNDHYARIDRRDELPDERKESVTIGAAPRPQYSETEAATDDFEEHLVTTPIDLMPAGWAESSGQELDLLETVHALRAQVAASDHLAELAPAGPDDDLGWLDFDVVQPLFEGPAGQAEPAEHQSARSPAEGNGNQEVVHTAPAADDSPPEREIISDPKPIEIAPPAPSGNRYAQLFTRLRWRRERIASERRQ